MAYHKINCLINNVPNVSAWLKREWLIRTAYQKPFPNGRLICRSWAVFCRIDNSLDEAVHYRQFFFFPFVRVKLNWFTSQLQTLHIHHQRSHQQPIFLVVDFSAVRSVHAFRDEKQLSVFPSFQNPCYCMAVNIISPCPPAAASRTLIFTSYFTHRNRKEKQHAGAQLYWVTIFCPIVFDCFVVFLWKDALNN